MAASDVRWSLWGASVMHHRMGAHRRARLCMVGLLVCGATWAGSAEQALALDEEARHWASVRREAPPRRLVLGQHFLTSNEAHLDLFYSDLPKESGGLMLGVGTDQNLVLAGWARPERVVIVDFDQWVVEMFWLYKLALSKADGPRRFIELWSPESQVNMRRWIRESEPKDASHRKLLLTVFRIARKQVYHRLKMLERKYAASSTPCLLNDLSQYRYVAHLFATDRWTAVRANFKGRRTLQDIAHTARRHQRSFKLVYLSNIEDYLSYTPQFKANIAALPCSDDAVLLRTSAHRDKVVKMRFHWAYITQSVSHFKGWLALHRVTHLVHIVGRGKYVINQLYRMTAPPGKRATPPVERSGDRKKQRGLKRRRAGHRVAPSPGATG